MPAKFLEARMLYDIRIENQLWSCPYRNEYEADFSYEYDQQVSPASLELEDRPDMKASEKLEAFINKMMKKAELLNTTREEQILKKQQILEELQKVRNNQQGVTIRLPSGLTKDVKMGSCVNIPV